MVDVERLTKDMRNRVERGVGQLQKLPSELTNDKVWRDFGEDALRNFAVGSGIGLALSLVVFNAGRGVRGSIVGLGGGIGLGIAWERSNARFVDLQTRTSNSGSPKKASRD